MIRFRAAEGVTKHRTDRVWRLGIVSRTLCPASAGLVVALALVGCSGNSAVASATTSLAPTPSRATASSATPTPTASSTATSAAPSQSREATPVPEKTLEQQVQDYLDGTNPKTITDRFLDNTANEAVPAPLTIFDAPVPFKGNRSYGTQAYQIGQQAVTDDNGNSYLENVVGYEDVNKERFVYAYDVGILGSGERCTLITHDGLLRRQPAAAAVSTVLTISEMQIELAKYNGKTIMLGPTFLGSPDSAAPDWVNNRMTTQNEAVKEFVTFLYNTSKESITKVPMSALLKRNVSTKGHLSPNLTSGKFDGQSTPWASQYVPYDI